MVELGTHALHAWVMGQGTPAVVIDVGIGGRSEEWFALQERLAAGTLVVVYDRAGYGRSEAGPLPRDSGREMDELKAMLDAASIPGPFVLVGHSLGGLNAQVFASRYPEETAGLVLLDPPPLGWLLGEGYPDLREMAERMTDDWRTLADHGTGSNEPAQRAEVAFYRAIASEHHEMFRSSARLAAAITSFGDRPVTVIASGVPNPAFGDDAEEFQRYWIDQSRAVAAKSSRGRFVLAGESTHRLHQEAADLVMESILSVVEAAGKGMLAGGHRHLPQPGSGRGSTNVPDDAG